MYVKHKEYLKYGEVNEDMFTQHKWVKKNQDKLSKRKQGEPPLVVAEFEHFQPQTISDDFFNHYLIIDYKEYVHCVNLDSK